MKNENIESSIIQFHFSFLNSYEGWVLTKQQRSFRQQKRVKPRPSFTHSTKKDNKILKTLLDQQRSVLKCEEILPLTEEEVNSLLHRIQNITTMGTEIFLRYFTNKPEVCKSNESRRLIQEIIV